MFNLQLSVAIVFVLISAPRSTGGQVNDTDVVPGSWVSDLFHRALANFTVRNVGSTACQKQSEMYDRHLQKYSNWAVSMSESWNRYPNGVLTGNRYHLGLYDECVGIHSPVKGKYCLSEVKLIPSGGGNTGNNNISHGGKQNLDNIRDSHAWQTILLWVDSSIQVPRNILNLGICIPDSCSSSDLQSTLQNELDKVFLPERVQPVVKVDPIMCTVSEDMYPYSTAYYITCIIFSLLILICVITTFYQYVSMLCKRNTTEAHEDYNLIISSFSIIESIKELFKYDKGNQLNHFNGLKVLTMVFILFGHRFMYLAGNPVSNSKFIENIYTSGPDILLTSMNLVDPFFFMSGYLMYLTIIPTFKKSGPVWMKLVSPIVYRIVRMLPAYCAMMAIAAHIVPHLGDGPLWPQKMWDDAEKCQNYWWINLLFISNLTDVKYQCLIVSWYISCDIQFFIIGVFVVYIYWKNKKFGIGILGVLIGLSLFLSFIITMLTKGDGILKVNLPFLENPRTSDTFNKLYRPSYMRATPFFIGLAVGFIVNKLNENKFKLSLKTVYGGTIIIIGLCVWVQLYGAVFYEKYRPYYPLEHALYATLSHCTWTIISSWIVICQFTTGYGLLARLFSNRLVVPLGRLSYSVFLVNLTVMNMSQSSQRLPSYLMAKTLIDMWIYDSFKSYLMGLMLYVVVEAPFGNLIKALFGRGKKKVSPNTNGVPPIEQIITIEITKKESTRL